MWEVVFCLSSSEILVSKDDTFEVVDDAWPYALLFCVSVNSKEHYLDKLLLVKAAKAYSSDNLSAWFYCKKALMAAIEEQLSYVLSWHFWKLTADDAL